MVKQRTKSDKIIWILTVVLFASFFLLEVITWGKYLFIILIALIALLSSQNPHDIFVIRIHPFQKFGFIFGLYCLTTAFWAMSPARAIEKGFSVLQIVFFFSFVYNYYVKDNNLDYLLSAIKIGAFLVVGYTILYYGGFSAISLASQVAEVRLNNSFSNVNEIGMLSALACILQINEIYKTKKIDWQCVLMIPAIFVIAATQSRTALFVLFVGIGMLLFFYFLTGPMSTKKIIKYFLLALVAIALVFLVINSGIFSGTIGRIENGTTAQGNFFYNPYTLRGKYKKIGWEYFKDNPIFGIGIGSSWEMLFQTVGKHTYTHDNYIELLSSGGVVGFILYYSMYVYLISNIVTYRRTDPDNAILCIVLILIFLITDTTTVSYTSKERYLFLMFIFIEVLRMRNIAINNMNETS